MASLTFSNTKTSALQNKINPTPLKPALNFPGAALVGDYIPGSLQKSQANASARAATDVSKLPKPYTSMMTPTPKGGGYTPPVAPITPPVAPKPVVQQTPPPTVQSPVQPPVAPTPSIYPNVVNQLANQGASPYNQSTQSAIGGLQGIAQTPNQDVKASQTGLQGIAQNQTPAVTNAQSDYNKFAQANPYALAAQSNPNVAADIASGRTSLLGQIFASELGAKQAAVSNALAGQGQQIAAGNEAGNLGLNSQGQQISAGSSAGNLAQSGQGLSQEALGSAAGFSAPQPYGLTTQPYNPTTDTFGGGGTGGAINRSIQASNIGSAGDFQSKIQNIQATKGAADANFDILNSYAQGFAGDSPLLNQIKQKYGTTIQGNEAVAGFQAQLQNVRAAYSAITGGDAQAAIPDAITPTQLKQVQQTLANTAQNNIIGFSKQLDTLKGSGQGSSTNSSQVLEKNSDGTLKAVKF